MNLRLDGFLITQNDQPAFVIPAPNMNLSYTKKIWWFILLISVLKMLAASLIELGNDEVYYWTYALQPDWNHFDHPPMVGWMIRVSTLNLHWVSELSLRLVSIVCAGFSTWFIFKTGKMLANERTGWYAAVIYNCSVYTGFIAGFFILPDSPQMLFWTCSLFIMANIICKQEDKKLGNWLSLGLMIGLATISKVHALYLWAGLGIFILCYKIKWLGNWRMYAGVLVTIFCVLPIIYWNIGNDFITYRFHSERVTHTSIQWDMLGREIGGEFAYQNPFVFILIIISLIALLRNKIHFGQKLYANWLLLMSLPMIALFWLVSLLNPTLPHWSGPAYIPLFFIAAIHLEKISQKVYPFWIKAGAALVFIVLFAGIALSRFSPINFGSQEKENFGEYCPTLDLSGWDNFSTDFAKLVEIDRANKIMKPTVVILTHKWFPGGHLEFYTKRKSGLELVSLGNLQDLHKFAWLNKDRKQIQLGSDAYVIVPSNLPTDVQEVYGKYFTTIEKPLVFNQYRGGSIVRYFYVYRLKNCKKLPVTIF